MLARPIAIALLVSMSGCYFYFKAPKNRARAPQVAPGATIDFDSESKTYTETCGDRDSREMCVLEGDGERRIRTPYVQYTATYQGQKLKLGELRALVDPSYNGDWDSIERKSKICKISIVPTVLAGVSLVVAAGALFYGKGILGDADRETDTTKAIMYGGIIGTVGFGVLSYPLGGFACVSAYRKGADMATVYYDDTEIKVGDLWGYPTKRDVAELATLIEAFNAKASGTTPTGDSEPSEQTPETPPAETPPAETPKPPAAETRAPSAVLDAVAATGKFPTFIKLIETAHIRELVPDGESYTLLIPTEEALAKLSKDRLTSLSKDTITWKQHILIGIRTPKQMLKDFYIDPLGGRHRVEERKNKQIVVGGRTIVGPAIKIPNGVIYPIDDVF